MVLYADIARQIFLSGEGQTFPLPFAEAIYGDGSTPVQVYFYDRKGANIALPAGTVGVFNVSATFTGASAAKSITWTELTDADGKTYYEWDVSFKTAALDTAFANDEKYHDYIAQIRYVEAGGDDQTIIATTLRIHNTNIRDGDDPDLVPTLGALAFLSSVGPGNLESTSVVAGTYTNCTVTVDEDGRITSIANGATLREGARITALDKVDATAAPPTEVNGDLYLLDEGTPHADWDGASANDLVTFDGTSWNPTTFDEGDSVYLDDVDAVAILEDGVWVVHDDLLTETNTKTVTNKTLPLASNGIPDFPVELIVPCSDEGTALATGTGKITFRAPYAFTLTGVRASVNTAPTGAALTIDLNLNGTSVLSTPLTIDATEKTSTAAATPAVISTASITDDGELSIDIDQIGSSVAGAGLKLTLLGTRAV